jgi:phosphohistidine phosphatase
MKTLILVRHAKSSWADEGLSDMERPLNERGKKDAPEMAKRLKKKISKIDLFLSSTARRAKKTAKYFAEEFGVSKDAIQLEANLYEDTTSAYVTLLSSLDDKHNTVALFAHSPAITDYANTLTNVHTDNIPTCGVFAVQSNAADWKEFIKAEKTFLFYDYPKNPLAQPLS